VPVESRFGGPLNAPEPEWLRITKGVRVGSQPHSHSALRRRTVGGRGYLESPFVTRNDTNVPTALAPQRRVIGEISIDRREQLAVPFGRKALRGLHSRKVIAFRRRVDKPVTSNDDGIDDRQPGNDTVVELSNGVDDALKNLGRHPRPRDIVNENNVDLGQSRHRPPHTLSSSISALNDERVDTRAGGLDSNLVEVGYGRGNDDLGDAERRNNSERPLEK
jgi:hypothetical protein